MKNQDFQNLLFKSAVMVMACDGDIADSEISEIKKMVNNEIYFMGYEFEEPLKNHIEDIKATGKIAINRYLQEIAATDFTEQQELLLIEVLLRMIEVDTEIKDSEIKFLQLVKSKLKTDEKTLIIKFPNHIDHLMDLSNYGLHEEFADEIFIK